MLIDAHVHLNNYHEHEDPHRPATERQVEALFAKMAERGVDHAVILTSYKINHDRPSVDDVLRAISGDPRASIVEGIRWSDDDRTDLEALGLRLESGQVKGVKLYPAYQPFAIDDPSLHPIFDVAADHNVPVLFHTGDTYAAGAKVRRAHPLLMDDVAVDRPDVTFVMCHAGNPWFTDAAEVIYKNDNVYADMSGLTLGAFTSPFERHMRDRLREMITYIGASERKLMFGSDWPLVKLAPYIDFLESLDVNEEAKDCMRWRTAARVFDIPVAE